jgi:OFA family oxalate/formate antiporter-like MFS transporter
MCGSKNEAGDWHAVFVVAALMNAVAAVAALAVPRSLRSAHHRLVHEAASAPARHP